MRSLQLIQFDQPKTLAAAAASDWLQWVHQRLQGQASCTIALSGGRIAIPFYDSIVSAFQNPSSSLPKVDFNRVHWFWADERCVPPSDPESNFYTAKQRLIDPLNLPASHVHRIAGELNPEVAAQRAEAELRSVCASNANSKSNGWPVLDLVILGMGEDGHVASLFPGQPACSEPSSPPSSAVYRSVVAVKPPPQRVTLTYEMLREAREVWVLASGKSKEAALSSSILSSETPLGKVRRSRMTLRIYSDIEGE